MANTYTDIYSIMTDVGLYSKLIAGSPITLGDIQIVAQNRWIWIVDNWVTLGPSFKSLSQYSDEMTTNYTVLSSLVQSYKLGNKTNPLESRQNFIISQPFLGTLNLQNLNLSSYEKVYYDQEKQRVSNLQLEDFQQMLSFLETYAIRYSETIGLGDATTSSLYGLTPDQAQRYGTIDDLDALQSLLELRGYIESLIWNTKRQAVKTKNPISLTNASIAAGATFDNSYTSYVTRAFEISLEHMAQKYMGTKDRWTEITIINNLKPPYIDEAGTKSLLLTSGSSNNILITSDLSEFVAVGVKVNIGSLSIREETRIIEKLVVNDNNTTTLFLSGSQDLIKLRTGDSAFIRVYSPGTTRTGQFVMIPSKSNKAGAQGPKPKSDALRRMDEALLSFGVDIARANGNGDIVLDQSGNFAMASGYSNVRQAVLSALQTNVGELKKHPDYGVNLGLGDSFFGSTSELQVFGQLLTSTLLKDKRFQSVKINSIESTGSGISVTITVFVAGYDQPIPLNFVS